MHSNRASHTATLLTNDNVLVAGGYSDDSPDPGMSAELYDPRKGFWSPTGSMSTARDSHTATLLTNGTVLVTGGFGSNGSSLASAELYHP